MSQLKPHPITASKPHRVPNLQCFSPALVPAAEAKSFMGSDLQDCQGHSPPPPRLEAEAGSCTGPVKGPDHHC